MRPFSLQNAYPIFSEAPIHIYSLTSHTLAKRPGRLGRKKKKKRSFTKKQNLLSNIAMEILEQLGK